jgi:hypothetical protein
MIGSCTAVKASAARDQQVHGLITRIPRSHRYQLTDTGLHHAMLLTHVHTRLLRHDGLRSGGRLTQRTAASRGPSRAQQAPSTA